MCTSIGSSLPNSTQGSICPPAHHTTWSEVEQRRHSLAEELELLDRISDRPQEQALDPGLASQNSIFDASTPGGPNYEAAEGQPTSPPAPPRDGLEEIGDLMECFSF